MQYATRFTHRKSFLMHREWSFCALEAPNTSGTSTSATSLLSGEAVASFPLNFFTGLLRRISATLRCIISCSIAISRESSKRHSAIGVSRFQQPVSLASLCLHFRRHSLTSIVIARLGCLQISCKHNAISSARTLTNESISPAYSTPNGSSRIKSPQKNRQNQKHPNRITPENDVRVGAHASSGYRSAMSLPKIVRLAPDEFF